MKTHKANNKYLWPRSTFPWKSAIAKLSAGLLVFILCYTALSKLLAGPEFERQMMAQVLPLALKRRLIEFLPMAELIIAALILWQKTRKAGLICSLILLVAFTLYIMNVMLFADRVPCSCGGFIRQLNWAQHLGLNIFLIAANLAALFLPHHLNDKAHQANQNIVAQQSGEAEKL